MEACKNTDEKRKRVNKKLRQRALKRTLNQIKQGMDAYIERRIRYAQMSGRYYVAHDYSIRPFEETNPINKTSGVAQDPDPYEGEDLFNIDHMDDEKLTF